MDERLKAAIEAGDGGAVGQLIGDEPGLAKALDGDLSAVMLAAYHQQPEIAAALLEARGPADLFEAAALGLEARVRDLIEWDPRCVVARSADGFTALHLSAFFGHPDIVRRLLAAGADVGPVADNPSKVQPLHSAVARGSLEAVEILLEAGAAVDARQEGGFTPLMGAAAAGATGLVGRLLEAGADPSAETDDGKTALDLAQERGHGEVEGLLAS